MHYLLIRTCKRCSYVGLLVFARELLKIVRLAVFLLLGLFDLGL